MANFGPLCVGIVCLLLSFAHPVAAEECDAGQAATAQAALQHGKVMLLGAVLAIDRGGAEVTENLRRWFGDEKAAASVRVVLANALKASSAVTLECYPIGSNAEDDLFADTLPADTLVISLGVLFWSAPEQGYNSKAGAIIHELTHSPMVADCDDFAYGEEDALTLAKDDPLKAIRNADNYEFFVESSASAGAGRADLDHPPVWLDSRVSGGAAQHDTDWVRT